MRRLRNLATTICVLLVAVGPLSAVNLNPVTWSLQPEQAKTTPGSAIQLRLHAHIAEGFHLYSFTTPAGAAVKTTASLQVDAELSSVRVYQPRPDRSLDPNSRRPIETFKTAVDFLLPVVLAANARPGKKTITARIRYQACSSEICLPPVIRMATTVVQVEPGPVTARSSIPQGYLLVAGL